MTFLALILALALMQAWGSGNRVQHDGWFHSLQARVAGWGLPPGIRLAVVILLPVLLAQLLLNALEPVMFGLLWIAMATLLLLYAMGRRDFHELLERYRGQCHREDFEGAYLTTLSELGWAEESDDPVSAQQVHALVQRGFLYEGFQRWFAVMFYFVLLGPAGALAYRLLHLCRHRFEAELVERCLYLADWVPVRLLAAAFSLAGDFVASRDQLLHAVIDRTLAAPQLLQSVSLAALGGDAHAPAEGQAFGEFAAAQNKEIASLLYRSAACWVVVIALLVLLV